MPIVNLLCNEMHPPDRGTRVFPIPPEAEPVFPHNGLHLGWLLWIPVRPESNWTKRFITRISEPFSIVYNRGERGTHDDAELNVAPLLAA